MSEVYVFLAKWAFLVTKQTFSLWWAAWCQGGCISSRTLLSALWALPPTGSLHLRGLYSRDLDLVFFFLFGLTIPASKLESLVRSCLMWFDAAGCTSAVLLFVFLFFCMIWTLCSSIPSFLGVNQMFVRVSFYLLYWPIINKIKPLLVNGWSRSYMNSWIAAANSNSYWFTLRRMWVSLQQGNPFTRPHVLYAIVDTNAYFRRCYKFHNIYLLKYLPFLVLFVPSYTNELHLVSFPRSLKNSHISCSSCLLTVDFLS